MLGQPHVNVPKLVRCIYNHLKKPRVDSARDGFTPGAQVPMLVPL